MLDIKKKIDKSDSIFWHKKGGNLSKTYEKYVYSIESIVFCDRKIVLILKKSESICYKDQKDRIPNPAFSSILIFLIFFP